MKTRIKTGDTVKIISGSNKGKTGKVLRVAPAQNKAFIEGIGNRTRHLRPTQLQKGGKKDIQTGIHISNLKLEKAAEKPAAKKEKK